MIIDFENFGVYRGIDRGAKDVMDVKRVFAEEIYNRGRGIAFHALALKIYNSNGPTEYTDEEFHLMQTFSEQCMSPLFIDSLRDAGGQQEHPTHNNEEIVVKS